VIGFDDIESAMLLGLSTVRQPLEDSGAEGARRLCALLRGERVTPLRQQLAVEVVSRSSTARFRVDQPPSGGPLVDHASSRRRSQPPQERYIELGSPGHGRPGWREDYG
jgi:hypothetical protein